MDKIKKLWKKCRIMLLVELIVVVAICACVNLTYKMIFELEHQKAINVSTNMDDMAMLNTSVYTGTNFFVEQLQNHVICGS